MKKVLKFILLSLIVGLLFAIFMELVEPLHNIYLFLISVLFGPVILSSFVILTLFEKNKEDKIAKNINLVFINKPVIIISVVTVAFTILYGIYNIGCLASIFILPHFLTTKNYNKAISIAKISDKIYPQNCIFPTFMAYSNFKKDNTKYEYYEKQTLTCYKGDYTRAYLKIAHYSERDSNYQDALEIIDKGLQVNEDSFVTHFRKQDIYFKVNDCQNGIKEIENILAIIDKKGAEKYTYKKGSINVEESLPDDWKKEVTENLSSCPNTKEKEELIEKLQIENINNNLANKKEVL